MTQNINLSQSCLADFCQRYHIKKLSLFGSVLREDFNAASDVDVLVEFEPTHTPGFLRLAKMEMELSAILDGRAVDLRTPDDLSRYFRTEVMKTAEVQYAQMLESILARNQ